jgi:hypothetical protein
MAGTIPFSLSQQFDRYGKPLSGGLFYLIQAGTTSTPQNAYQDSDLTIALPNPIQLDAAGRLPQFFLADGTIKVRLVDKDGVVQLTADGVQVVGPSSGGGGGGGTVDATTIFQVGDVLWQDASGTRDGWVRDNGRTIGSATSGATERAASDCEALFGYLWQKFPDTTCPVAGGRGASSSADWGANKTIQMPDKRLYVPGGLAGMGNTALTLPSGVPIISGDAVTAGSCIGASTHVLTAAQLAEHTHSGRTDFMDSNQEHAHSSNAAANNGGATTGGGSFTSNDPSGATINPANIDHRHYFTTDKGAGITNSAHNNMQLTVLGTFYRKL